MTHAPAIHKLNCCLLVLSLLSACREDAQSDPSQTRKTAIVGPKTNAIRQEVTPRAEDSCPKARLPHIQGRAQGDHLQEISGIVASRGSGGLFWVHNDSGDRSRVYGIDIHGNGIGSLEIPPAVRDVEDIALGHGQGQRDLIYIADVGDNFKERSEGVFIHRFQEPTRSEIAAVHPAPHPIEEVETMRIRYVGGPRDAEALLVDPDSGEIVLITKPHMSAPEVFFAPEFAEDVLLKEWGTITEQSSGSLIRLVTAADVSPDGRWILLRTYSDIFAFRRKSGASLASSLLGKACRLKPAHENQGEAIGFLSDGAAPHPSSARLPPFLTIGEGVSQPLYLYE